MNRILRLLRQPFHLPYLIFVNFPSLRSWLSDEQYLRVIYRFAFRKSLNLANARTYSEKLQWLKLHDRNPLYPQVVDKLGAKEWAARIIGDKHIVPTIGVWDSFDAIDFDQLPDRFVLKTTHDSGGVVVCKDKSQINKARVGRVLAKSLALDYSRLYCEWPYGLVPRRIIAEEYLDLGDDGDLRDYKFLCFQGRPRIMYIMTGRDKGELRKTFFDIEFNRLNVLQDYEQSDVPLSRPKHFGEMVDLATKLSQGFPHVRIDFYENGDKVLFGEATLYTHAGLSPFEPAVWDDILGDWLDLPSAIGGDGEADS